MLDEVSIVKRKLTEAIAQLCEVSWMFVKDPKRDFTKKRKLPFDKVISFLLAMEGGTLTTELLKYFSDPIVHKEIEEENAVDPLADVDKAILSEKKQELAKILREIPSAEEIGTLLKKAGAPAEMNDIGLPEELIPLSAKLSPYVRRRLTCMRLIKLTGFEL